MPENNDAVDGNRDGARSTRAIVVHPALRSGASSARSPQARLDEAVGLAEAISLDVLDGRAVPVPRPQPATLFGSGSVETIGAAVLEHEAALVIVDHPLTPVQQRNLERTWKAKVIDRTGLILEIFGERARTAEGKLQVELAALSYQRSRLVRSWTHLERQRGGFGFLGGPGESQLEMDRRLITTRIARIRRELEEVKRTRELHRSARRRVPYPIVALVGYTNAGKSTLFNRMAHAEAFAENLLFATLDPTMRGVELPSGQRIILADTVGFISDLPTHLVAAFRATLEEVIQADLILHVRDISHPDTEAQRDDVMQVLTDLGIDEGLGRVVEVFNKIDQLPSAERLITVNQAARRQDTVATSALSGEGLDRLFQLVDGRLTKEREIVELDIDLSDGAALASVYRSGEVLQRWDDDEHAHLRIAIASSELARFASAHPYRPVERVSKAS